MATPIPQKKRVPLGRALALPEADDPETASPDQRDIQQASERVKISTLIAAIFAGLLLWDRARLQYRTKSGLLIPNKAIEAELNRIVTTSQLTLRTISQTLVDRTISLPTWQMAVRDEIKGLHYIAASVAQGGPQNVTPAAIQRIGELTQPQYEKLNQFAAQVEAGQKVTSEAGAVKGTEDTTPVTKSTETVKTPIQPLNGKVLQRAALYGGAARATFHETRIQEAIANGMTVAERIRHADESCPGCVETEGFWLAGDVPPIGSQECINNCLCEIVLHDELPEGEELNDSVEYKAAAKEIVSRQLEMRQALR